MFPTPPTPARQLLCRWQRLRLLYFILLGPQRGGIEQLSFVIDRSNVIRGLLNDYTGNGGWIAACGDVGAVLYGSMRDFPGDWDITRKIENHARDRLSSIPKELRALVRPKHPKSIGWSFAMWSEGLDGPWQDLTGRDPECVEFSRFDDAVSFLGDEEAAVDWLIEKEYEGVIDSTLRPQILKILFGKPLTKALAKSLQQESTVEEIFEFARSVGYPVKS